MSKNFKIGDKVKVLDENLDENQDEFYFKGLVGEVAKVVKDFDEYAIKASFENLPKDWGTGKNVLKDNDIYFCWFKENQLEKVVEDELKVGDNVQIIATAEDKERGWVGLVGKINNILLGERPYKYNVLFDNNISTLFKRANLIKVDENNNIIKEEKGVREKIMSNKTKVVGKKGFSNPVQQPVIPMGCENFSLSNNSSQLKHYYYDNKNQILFVTFHNNKTYAYENVTKSTYNELLIPDMDYSSSKFSYGKKFKRIIDKKFNYVELT